MQPLDAGEPTVVGPYRLLGRLGSGGMGRVYLGRSAGGRTVAVKIVHPHFALDEEFRARFRREVDAARRVGGSWTAPVLDADPEASVPWVATGYAAGPSLAAAIADGGHLPPHSVRVLGAGLAEALSAVHALGLVHRDVKPSNVLLTVDGPLLIDFGIARATDGTASLTSTGVSIGSPGYMSPEQILGKGITGAADVFSLGAVLAYAATGQSPFPGDSSAALLYKVVHEPPLLDGLEGDLRDLVERCLAKDAAARPGPDEIARTLALEGAARLVSAGWLPGPLVEQVGRSAVQVLNLEAAADVPSGPVGFSSPSVAGGPTGDGPAASGVFGPPPVMSSQVSQASQASPASPETYVPGQRTEGVVADAAPPAPGKLSVSVAASSTAAANGRGRRVSCSVALAIAGVFALVGVGMLVGPGTLWGREDKGDAADKVPSAEASPSGSGQDTGAPGDATGELPKKYLGTWEGDGYALSGSLPAGTFTVTLEQTAVGGTLGTFRSVDLLGGTCDDKLVLKKVTEKNIVATSIADTKNNPGTCTRNTHEITLTPVGKELDYTSTNADAGRPTARLAKVE
ncbi:putative serine/threonine protein kinase [Streptomyces scabiei 87.22]|uniref:Putative serine/threonine protein kinase n=1 Tax=Streptomyces scabiei (strain 87.22) TaxID=680198 RepID=C9YXX3_STRSW|nr:serine/threonine-protein kinase [Streptomyces scabiei]MDX2577402.1 serine/threonine-protein kinase [Streptomyces scabiei]MDX2657113.1 serine/threonine-protein kinase [Streptomyces scabiei]MDX2720024.1 serine/threonine-protein kinase [Streptomyces scabiei]MDX2866686.1 serine/threonine-protein kinase [Streptomyces scabiei]MDX2882938.1 serine/threonine-protein kinase [Streptomyces scabiei]